MLPVLALGDAVSVLALGEAAAALGLGDAVSALTLGVAVSALALGVAVSLPALGDGVVIEGVLSAGLAAIDVSTGEEVEAGSLPDAVEDVAEALLFVVAFEVFELLGAFLGADSVSAIATLEGATLEDEVTADGVGAAFVGALASATTVDGAELVVAALVSAGSGDMLDSVAFATLAGAAMTFASIRWLNASAPAITRAMMMPKAMGKCFTEASCWDRQSPSDRKPVGRLRS